VVFHQTKTKASWKGGLQFRLDRLDHRLGTVDSTRRVGEFKEAPHRLETSRETSNRPTANVSGPTNRQSQGKTLANRLKNQFRLHPEGEFLGPPGRAAAGDKLQGGSGGATGDFRRPAAGGQGQAIRHLPALGHPVLVVSQKQPDH
jgi:hypothetical protein